LSAPAPQSGCAEGWYRLKRKSVSGNGISFPHLLFLWGLPILFWWIVSILAFVHSIYNNMLFFHFRFVLTFFNIFPLFLLGVYWSDDSHHFWNNFWYYHVPLQVSFSLFFLSAYFIVHSFRYTELGKERAKRWRRFEEWLIELPLSPQELAKHVETYLPYAIALGVPKRLFTFVRRYLGERPAPAWFEALPPSKDSPQKKNTPIQYPVTMRYAMERIEMTVDNIFSKVYRVEKGENSVRTTIDFTSLSPFNPATLLHFYYKSQADLSKRQIEYSLTAYGRMVVGSLLIGISLFQLMQSWEMVW
jgi:hypothetical protein